MRILGVWGKNISAFKPKGRLLKAVLWIRENKTKLLRLFCASHAQLAGDDNCNDAQHTHSGNCRDPHFIGEPGRR